MTREELRDELIENIMDVLENLYLDDEATVMQYYCDAMNYSDDCPMPFDECVFNEMCCGMNPSYIIEQYKNVDFSWKYVYYSIYGIEEWNGIETTSTYKEVAQWIADSEEDCGIDELETLLSEYNDDLEELENEEEKDE